MSDSTSFADFMARLRARDEQAAAELFDETYRGLVLLARRRLNMRICRLVDPDDVAQEVFLAFFRGLYAGRFTLTDWNGLWGLLRTIAIRECTRQTAAHYTNGRDVRRAVTPQDGSIVDPEWASPQATSSDVVAARDMIQSVMHHLDDRGREVLGMRLKGCTAREIGRRICRTERTVFRILDDIQSTTRRLSELQVPA